MGEAEDAIERRTDFVAHVGQELGLDAAGLEGLLACQVQFDVLDLDGLEVLLHILGGLVDALLELFSGTEQRLGHAVDAGGQLVHLMAAERWQARLQVALLELRHRHLDLVQRPADGAAHAQGQQRGDDQPRADQQQAGEEAAIATQQGALMRQLEFEPADLAHVVAEAVGRQVQVLAKNGQQDARGVDAADAGQGFRIGRWRGVIMFGPAWASTLRSVSRMVTARTSG